MNFIENIAADLERFKSTQEISPEDMANYLAVRFKLFLQKPRGRKKQEKTSSSTTPKPEQARFGSDEKK